MVKKINFLPPLSVVRGQQITARYTEQQIPEYQGNPLIEALPHLWSKDELTQLLSYFPYYNSEQRKWPNELRLNVLENCREFFIPQGIHYEIHLSISNMIRRSYIFRNPVEWDSRARQIKGIDKLKNRLQRGSFLRSKARGLTIVGVGGVGKSTAVENILSCYPQVITHTNYKESDLILRQLVWVKLDCPADGSLKGLCLNYIQEVDDILGLNYLKNYGSTRRTLDELLLIMARIASNHYQGVMVIDEIQELSEAKSGGATHMLNFFVQMENSLGVPFILIATPKIKRLFAGEFRQARRISEQGDLVWRPMKELAEKDSDEEPEKVDPDWDTFVRAMWRYWYLQRDHKLPDNLLKDRAVRALYRQSQGITAVVVTIFFLAQRRAITSGKEDITASVINHTVKDNQHYISEMLERLREGHLKPQGPRPISDLDLFEEQSNYAPQQKSRIGALQDKNNGDIHQGDIEKDQERTSLPVTTIRKPKNDKGGYESGDLRNLSSKVIDNETDNQAQDSKDMFEFATEFLE